MSQAGTLQIAQAFLNQCQQGLHPEKEPLEGEISLIDGPSIFRSCGGDPALLRKMVTSFHVHVRSHLTEVAKAVRHEDTKELHSAAHKLRGLVSAFSTSGAKTVQVLEETTDAQPAVEIRRDYARAAAVVRKLCKALSDIYAEN
jgi:HPt (histidine-containing phosphotransfer) domain-containing protein